MVVAGVRGYLYGVSTPAEHSSKLSDEDARPANQSLARGHDESALTAGVPAAMLFRLQQTPCWHAGMAADTRASTASVAV
jgi:hypothetical protein